jgi:hypothetical protein
MIAACNKQELCQKIIHQYDFNVLELIVKISNSYRKTGRDDEAFSKRTDRALSVT